MVGRRDDKGSKSPDEAETEYLESPISDAPTDQVGRLAARKSPESFRNPGETILIQPGGADDDAEDYVTGWLIIIEGNGKGNAVETGHGVNSIGLAPDSKIALDYGDDSISYERHATLTYDGRSRRFFLQHGESDNLTYLGDEPVINPVELKGGEHIVLGNTRLLFVPFCGPDFSWDDV